VRPGLGPDFGCLLDLGPARKCSFNARGLAPVTSESSGSRMARSYLALTQLGTDEGNGNFGCSDFRPGIRSRLTTGVAGHGRSSLVRRMNLGDFPKLAESVVGGKVSRKDKKCGMPAELTIVRNRFAPSFFYQLNRLWWFFGRCLPAADRIGGSERPDLTCPALPFPISRRA
jgi:hypothetical protein